MFIKNAGWFSTDYITSHPRSYIKQSFMFIFILQGTDDLQHLWLLGFQTLFIVLKTRKTRFRNWICFHPQVREETSTLMGPLEKANQMKDKVQKPSNSEFTLGLSEQQTVTNTQTISKTV
jgi:hypothetical protein